MVKLLCISSTELVESHRWRREVGVVAVTRRRLKTSRAREEKLGLGVGDFSKSREMDRESKRGHLDSPTRRNLRFALAGIDSPVEIVTSQFREEGKREEAPVDGTSESLKEEVQRPSPEKEEESAGDGVALDSSNQEREQGPRQKTRLGFGVVVILGDSVGASRRRKMSYRLEENPAGSWRREPLTAWLSRTERKKFRRWRWQRS